MVVCDGFLLGSRLGDEGVCAEVAKDVSSLLLAVGNPVKFIKKRELKHD